VDWSVKEGGLECEVTTETIEIQEGFG